MDWYWKYTRFESGDHLTSLMTASYCSPNICRFTSIGHYVQQAKSVLFQDYISFDALVNANNADEQKSIGYKIAGFDEATWKKWKPIILASALAACNQKPHVSWKTKWVDEHNKRVEQDYLEQNSV